jgi:hypothetical protein
MSIIDKLALIEKEKKNKYNHRNIIISEEEYQDLINYLGVDEIKIYHGLRIRIQNKNARNL